MSYEKLFIVFLRVAFLVVVAATASCSSSKTKSLLDDFTQFRDHIDSLGSLYNPHHVLTAQSLYQRKFGDQIHTSRARNLDIESMSLLFEASYLLAMYTLHSDDIATLNSIGDAMISSGTARERDIKDLVDANFAGRNFVIAKKYGDMIDESVVFPEMSDARQTGAAAGTKIIIPETNSSGVTYTAGTFNLDGNRIVIVSHPQCPFSGRAAQSIHASPRLREIFSRHALWLSPPLANNLSGKTVADWSEKYPDFRWGIAFRRGEFPAIERWSLPSFYFFSDGQLIHTFTGWRSDENIKLVFDGLEKINLLPPSTTDSDPARSLE